LVGTGISGLTNALFDVQLPKFKMKVGSFSLVEGLKELGMQAMFTTQADLSGITINEPLMATEVLQQAFIAVDENGTEAAAATTVIVGVGSVAPAKTPFVAWANGGCIKDGLAFAEFLTEIASNGFLIVADGMPNGSGGEISRRTRVHSETRSTGRSKRTIGRAASTIASSTSRKRPPWASRVVVS
jgi:hypothetical protein